LVELATYPSEVANPMPQDMQSSVAVDPATPPEVELYPVSQVVPQVAGDGAVKKFEVLQNKHPDAPVVWQVLQFPVQAEHKLVELTALPSEVAYPEAQIVQRLLDAKAFPLDVKYSVAQAVPQLLGDGPTNYLVASEQD
jgi:hypothetical protein